LLKYTKNIDVKQDEPCKGRLLAAIIGELKRAPQRSATWSSSEGANGQPVLPPLRKGLRCQDDNLSSYL